jgi:hypothetical protein
MLLAELRNEPCLRSWCKVCGATVASNQYIRQQNYFHSSNALIGVQ